MAFLLPPALQHGQDRQASAFLTDKGNGAQGARPAGDWTVSNSSFRLRVNRKRIWELFGDLAVKFRAVGAIEKAHEERYRKLLQNIETKQAFEKSGVTVWECRNCGHLVVGTKAPEICPVCAHPQSYFEVRAENY